MDQVLNAEDRDVLVDIVKLAQKQGMEGAKGGWKGFLEAYDKKFGACLSDPQKRSTDVLVAFLKTFTKEEDLKFFDKVITRHKNNKAIQQFTRNDPNMESPVQRLVRLTTEHPLYRIEYSFPSHNKEWVITRLGEIPKALKTNAMVAVDCEMVLCQDGTDAVVRVCAVDHNMQVKLDRLVNPGKAVLDYKTNITGVSKEDLEGVTCSLKDVQKELKRLLRHGTILVGHSLNNDLCALKLDHARVIDTSLIFKYLDFPTNRRPSLNNLCKSVLGCEVRKEGAPHNCLEDARAAMKLVLAKLAHGFDDPLAISIKESENELSKLLLHGISVSVPVQELLKIFPDYLTVEMLPVLRVRGKKYSTFAVLKDSKEADEAYKKINGKEEKDSYGKPQKLVTIELGEGTTNFYVRKMVTEGQPEQSTSSRKRSVEEVADSKRLKPCNSVQCDHGKEVEQLKKELRQKDEEIFNLQKILSALTRKHGL
ncbi:small RNA degrading nuclease 1-like [Aristolochia californica]|uniref:small RNA degrading nuclease 1-like n=1 Tax=Aristolochia californica TaxID=171875 RepID=UPI0035D7D886